MTLRVVGAGVGRTGTQSLKMALEQLLGAPCYHMSEVFARPDDVPRWQQAVDTGDTDWDAVFDGYVAAVDWPAGSFWPELMAKYPDAIVLLSTRDAEDWYRSARNTIFNADAMDGLKDMADWRKMTHDMMRTRFTDDWADEAACIRAFDEHNAKVRATVPAERLIEWKPGDGWQPLCDALALPVPSEPYPHVNTTEQFRDFAGLPPV